MVATGSDTAREKFSVTVFLSLSAAESDTINSPCDGNGRLIYPGFQSPALEYLNPSLEVIDH